MSKYAATKSTSRKGQSLQEWASAKPSAPHYGGFSTESLRSPLKQDAWVAGCVRHLKNAFMSVKLEFTDGEDSHEDPESPALKSGHPIVDLFQRYNPLKGQMQMQSQLALYLAMTGEALIMWGQKNGNAVPVLGGDAPDGFIRTPYQFNVVRGGRQRLEIKKDPETGLPAFWKMQGPKGPRLIKYASTTPVFYESEDPLRGCGPMEPAFGPSAQNYLIWLYNNGIISEGEGPKGTVTFPEMLNDTEYERAQEEVHDAFDSPQSAGETKVLHGGATHQEKSMSTKEMRWPDLFEANKDAICAAFGVAPPMLGENTANFATFRGMWAQFWILTIIPDLNLVASILNNNFFPRLLDQSLRRVRCRYNLKNVQAIQGELKEQAEAARGLQAMGVPLNQALEQSGIRLDLPVEGGDVPIIQGTWIPLADAVEPPEPEPAPESPPAPAPEEDEEDAPDEDEGDEEERSLIGCGGRPLIDEKLAAQGPQDLEPETFEFKAKGITLPVFPRAGGVEGAPEQATRPATKTERKSFSEERQREEKASQGRITREVKAVFRDMRKAQLDRLRSVAADDGSQSAASMYARSVRVSDSQLSGLLEACRADFKVGTVKVPVRSCDGEELFHVEQDCWEHRSKWMAKRLPLAERVGPDRLCDLALLRGMENPLTETEVDHLLAVQEGRWAEALGERLGSAYGAVAARAAGALAADAGITIIDVQDPRFLRFLNDKAIEVAEGVTSTVAKQVRSAIVRAITENSTVGSLAARLRESFDAVNAATKRQFNIATRRSTVIARTEVGQIVGSVRFESMKEAQDKGEIEGHEWVDAGDGPPPAGRTRWSHVDLGEREPQPVGEPYITIRGNSLRFARDPMGAPEEIIQCRCAMRAILIPVEQVQPEEAA